MVVSVNGSTDFPVTEEVSPGTGKSYSVTFDQEDYEASNSDWRIEAPQGVTVEYSYNSVTVDVSGSVPIGSTVNIFCIDTQVAAITVAAVPIRVNPRIIFGSNKTVNIISDIWDKIPGIPTVLEGSSIVVKLSSGNQVCNGYTSTGVAYRYDYGAGWPIALSADAFQRVAPGSSTVDSVQLVSITVGGVTHEFIDY